MTEELKSDQKASSPKKIYRDPYFEPLVGFTCLIDLIDMDDPYIAFESGYSYGRDAIRKWQKEKGTDPQSRVAIKVLEDNISLRLAIAHFQNSKKLANDPLPWISKTTFATKIEEWIQKILAQEKNLQPKQKAALKKELQQKFQALIYIEQPDTPLPELINSHISHIQKVREDKSYSIPKSHQELDAGILPGFTCPITKSIMKDPYFAADGYSYEKDAIEAWLAKYDFSPVAPYAKLKHKKIVKNYQLLEAIHDFQHKWVTPEQHKSILKRIQKKGKKLLEKHSKPKPEHNLKEEKTVPILLRIAEAKSEIKLTHPLAATERFLCAIQYEDPQEVDRLIKEGVAVDLSLTNTNPPIFEAIKHQNTQIFERILKANADIFLQNCNGQNLAEAIALTAPWPPQTKKIVLEKLAERGMCLPTILHAACIGDMQLVEKHLAGQKQVIMDSNSNTAIMYAAANGQISVIKACLKKNKKYLELDNEFGLTPLMVAACNDQVEAMEFLKNNGASLIHKDTRNNTAFLRAVGSGRAKSIKYLFAPYRLKQKDHYERTPLLLTAANFQPEIMELFLKNGASLDERDMFGNTLLLLATIEGNINLIEWLLKNKLASLDERNHGEQNPILIAASNGHVQLISWLIQTMNMSLEVVDIGGSSPLHFAATSGHAHMVEWLLKNGEQLNKKNKNGDSPLVIATKYNQVEAVAFILNYLSKNLTLLTQEDECGCAMALSVAAQNDFKEIAALFKDFNNKILASGRIAVFTAKESSSSSMHSISRDSSQLIEKNIHIEQPTICQASFFAKPESKELSEQLQKELTALKKLLENPPATIIANKGIQDLAEKQLAHYQKPNQTPTQSDLNLVQKIRERLETPTLPVLPVITS